jgi:hypothetical protein
MSDPIDFEQERKKRKGQPAKAAPFTPPPPRSLKQVEEEWNYKYSVLCSKYNELLEKFDHQRDYLHLLIKKLKANGTI